jgi:predicted RNA-binding Zn-ribbon protein involved in translation (DUF1610 family)
MAKYTCDACGKRPDQGASYAYFECDKCGKTLCLACLSSNTSVHYTSCQNQPNGTSGCTGSLRRKSGL